MFVSTVQDLINALRTRNPEAQVFLMTQRKNPRENLLAGVVGREEMVDQRYRVENGIQPDDVFLAVGRQLRPGSLSAWIVAESRDLAPQANDEVPRTRWQITLAQIAKQHLGIETLQVRNTDDLDVHEIRTAALRSALTAAYRAGVTAGIYCAVDPDDADVPDEHEPDAGGVPGTAVHPAASGPHGVESAAGDAPALDATDATDAAPRAPDEHAESTGA